MAGHEHGAPVAPTAAEFVLPVRVYWEDTDAGGVVYHSVYLNFFERARSEWLRALGICQRELASRELVQFVVVGMDMRWHRPARYDDELLISARPTERRGATLAFRQEVRRGAELLAGAEVRVAALNATTFRPVRIPPRVVARLGDLRDSGGVGGLARTAPAGGAIGRAVRAAADAGIPSPITDRPVSP